MTATDDLRRLLDERGVKYETKDRPAASHADWEAWMRGDRHQTSGAIRRETLWGQPTDVASGKPIPHVYHYRATEMGDGRLFLEAQLVTPEQAIVATLGDSDATAMRQAVETCKDVCADVSEFTCSACGFNCELASWISLFDGDEGRHRHHYHGTPNFCPNCGRKVVAE